ncbi:putative sugar transporter [Lanmaoa asiatica]|nr:putative sugar transporter [Lanmaoa asiatica]
MDKVGHPRLRGTALVAAITSVCSLGFWLFGYDQGVMSGVVISQPWLTQMGNPSTVMIGTITSLYDIGAVVGAIVAASSSERLGRKRTLILGAIILIIGSVLMGSSFERIQMMVARVITGIARVTHHIYLISDSCLPERDNVTRAPRLLSTVAVPPSFPVRLRHLRHRRHALASGNTIVGSCSTTVRPDRGTTVLAKLRGVSSDHPVVQHERAEILNAIALEAKEKGSWSDLFKDHGIRGNKRFYLALGIQFMQQMTGINIVTYYAPTLFQQSLGMTQERSLFVGCFLQVWYIIASFVTWYTIDRVGRRKLWISMAYGQCLVLVLEAICVKLNTSRASIGAVFLIFAYEACFTWGWMATVWIYPPEILPLKLRAKGAALAAAADFLGNFVVVQITPPALRNIGYKTYIIFAVFNFVNAYIVWAFYPETAGLTLESVDDLFRRDDKPAGSHKFGLQWSIVGKAADTVERVKRDRATGVEGAVQSGMAREKDSVDSTEVQIEAKSL